MPAATCTWPRRIGKSCSWHSMQFICFASSTFFSRWGCGPCGACGHVPVGAPCELWWVAIAATMHHYSRPFAQLARYGCTPALSLSISHTTTLHLAPSPPRFLSLMSESSGSMDLPEDESEVAAAAVTSPPARSGASPELRDGKDGDSTPSPWKMAGPSSDGGDGPGGKLYSAGVLTHAFVMRCKYCTASI